MGAFEASLVVCSSIDSNLLDWVDSLITPHTFFSGTTNNIQYFVRSSILIISRLFWFQDFRGTFKTLVQTASSLEELIKVRPAVQNPLKRIVVAELEGTPAVVASEAGLVVHSAIGG
jgi:hypothetical protein